MEMVLVALNCTCDFNAAHCAYTNRIVGNTSICATFVGAYCQKAHIVLVIRSSFGDDFRFIFHFYRPFKVHLHWIKKVHNDSLEMRPYLNRQRHIESIEHALLNNTIHFHKDNLFRNDESMHFIEKSSRNRDLKLVDFYT